MRSIIKHHRVEVRIQGIQNISNPELIERSGKVFFRYNIQRIGILTDGIYQRLKQVFSWAYEDKKHFWSDRPNGFTLPGGVFRVFDITENGELQECIDNRGKK